MNFVKFGQKSDIMKITASEALDDIRSQISKESYRMKKIWSRRIAQDLVSWFRILYPEAYDRRYD